MRPIARGQMKDGRRFGRPPDPFTPRAVPQGKINVQGYNAQAATNSKHIVIAAEVNADSPDFGHLAPMVDAAQHELAAIGIRDTPRSCWPTPATGIKTRSRTSSTAASRS
jgi:hypothetical protein